MPFNPKPDGALQFGKGGLPKPDPYAATMLDSCCGSGKVDIDTLVNPLGADNRLSHTTPTGCRDFGVFGSREQEAENVEMIEYINDVGIGAIIYLLRLPSFAQVTSFAASVMALDPGLSFKVVGRNGLPLPTTGKKIEVPREGCQQKNLVESTAALTALDALVAPAAANDSEHFVFMGGTIDTLMGNSNDIGIQVVTMPTSGKVTANNLLELTVSYDVPLFLRK